MIPDIFKFIPVLSLFVPVNRLFSAFWGAAIAAGAALGASYLSSKTSKSINSDNLGFQREIAQNGVRWKVEDMKAAGLNPVMISGVNGATASGGSSAMPDFSSIGHSGNSVATSLMRKESKLADAKIAETNNAIAVQNSQILANNATAVQQEATAQKALADAEKARADAGLSVANTEKTRKETTQIPSLSQAEVDHEAKRKYAGFIENELRGLASPVLGVLSMAERFGKNQGGYTRERAERAVDAYLSQPGTTKVDPEMRARLIEAVKREMDEELKKKAEDTARPSLNEGGVKTPDGRSRLY